MVFASNPIRINKNELSVDREAIGTNEITQKLLPLPPCLCLYRMVQNRALGPGPGGVTEQKNEWLGKHNDCARKDNQPLCSYVYTTCFKMVCGLEPVPGRIENKSNKVWY